MSHLLKFHFLLHCPEMANITLEESGRKRARWRNTWRNLFIPILLTHSNHLVFLFPLSIKYKINYLIGVFWDLGGLEATVIQKQIGSHKAQCSSFEISSIPGFIKVTLPSGLTRINTIYFPTRRKMYILNRYILFYSLTKL